MVLLLLDLWVCLGRLRQQAHPLQRLRQLLLYLDSSEEKPPVAILSLFDSEEHATEATALCIKVIASSEQGLPHVVLREEHAGRGVPVIGETLANVLRSGHHELDAVVFVAELLTIQHVLPLIKWQKIAQQVELGGELRETRVRC